MSNIYRTRTCGDLSNGNIGESVKLSGWVDTKRDHGGVLFIDLRDNYGKIQIVADEERCKISNLDELAKVHNESVICVDGKVVERSDETKNPKIKNGDIEVLISKFEVLSNAEVLPFQVNEEDGTNEEVRLKYRFLELRKEKLHNTIIFRAKVFAYIRQRMAEAGFYEYQTPILTASSPEGARDFLVPSRLHKGQFYALPQAPQQFKQLLMIAGFDKYFQIAPCFRDEDPRADRSPGEFYQLDMEMSFVDQEDIFQTMEPVAKDIFNKFKGENDVICDEIRRIKFKDAMLKYGSDKPDLRIPIENVDATDAFVGSDFKAFAGAIEKGCVVRGTPVNNIGQRSRSFYDGMVEFAIKQGAKGLGYIIFENGEAKGPVAKFLSKDRLEKIHNKMILNDNGIIPNNLISYSKLFKNSCELEWGKDVSVGVASRVCGKIANECLKQNLDSLTIFVFNQQTCICGESVIGPYKEICDKKNNRWKYLFFDNNDCNLNNSIIEKNILTHISCQKTKKQVLLDVENGKYDIVLQNLQQSFNNSKEDLYAYNCCKFIINSIKSHSFDKIDAIFFSCDKEENANKFAGLARKELGARLNLIDKNRYELCWIIDFPFYEWNEDEKKIDFSHNPFSKPKCDVETLKKASKDELLSIEANQYDLVCNGYELASGAIRNSNIDMMYEAFKIAGYSKEDVDSKFGGMRKAFNYGAPPHGGMAIGIERLIMLLLKTDNIRDVIAFPLNGRAEDLLMNAPSEVSAQQLKDLGIKVVED